MELDKNEVYSNIQKIVGDRPLLLVGSGASVDYGIPGMDVLAEYLVDNLESKYKNESAWIKFKEQLDQQEGLERALAGIELGIDLEDDIRKHTWKLISQKDQDVFQKYLIGQVPFPIAALIRFIFNAHPQTVDIVTTNYDRIIEYACDQAGLPASLGFEGEYYKKYKGIFPDKKCVHILKVHGSLDMFHDQHGRSFAAPMFLDPDDKFTPEIIVPGDSKYKAILRGTMRELLTEADNRIKKATGFLCIGYGFNDNQIQEEIVRKMQENTPVILLTKSVTDSAMDILEKNSKNYICIQEGMEPGSTEICTNDGILVLDEQLWTIDGLMKMIS